MRNKLVLLIAIIVAVYLELYPNLCFAFSEPFICPNPKQMVAFEGKFVFKKCVAVIEDSNECSDVVSLLKNEMCRYVSVSFSEDADAAQTIRLEIRKIFNHIEGYRLTIAPDSILITGNDKEGLRNGLVTLLWLIRDAAVNSIEGKSIVLDAMRIEDWPEVLRRGLDLQLCYAGPDMDFMHDSARSLAMLKYNAITPDLGLFYIPENVAVSKEAASHLPANFKLTDRAKFREWVVFCEQWGLEVIPKVNCLGHSERGLPWVSALGRGLDVGDERNYTVIYAVIDAYLEDCPNTKYIHLGMDEAVDCLRENSKKYNTPAYQLLSEHINKVVAYCQKRNVIPIVYHDMLLGEQEKIYWREGVTNGTELETYKVRALIPKNVVINYWNYEGFERYRTVENFQKEGFEVWLTPWAGSSVRTMGQNASVLGCSVIGGTWVDCTYTDSIELGGKYRMFYTAKWLQDAISNLAEITWNSSVEVKKTFDAGLVIAGLYWDRPIYNNAKTKPIGLPETDAQTHKYVNRIFEVLKLKSGTQNFKGIKFAIDINKAVVLGNVDPVDVSGIMNQPKPWSIVIDGKKCGEISGVNKVRGSNECILYTRDFGQSTLTSQYGTEAVIRCGQTHYCDTWGVGNNAIPRNGYVLSGQGGYKLYPNGGESYDNEAFSGYHAVGVVDANGNDVALGVRPSKGASWATLSINRKAKSLVFLHTTAYEAAHFMEPIVNINVIYTDGKKCTSELRYGRDICSYDDICFLYEKNELPQRWIAYADYGKSLNDGKVLYAYQWNNPEPDKKISHIEFSVNDIGNRIGYIVLSLVSVE